MPQIQPSEPHGGLFSVTQVATYLSGIHFPLSKQDLVQYAQEKGAPQEIVDLLDELPERTFDDLTEVMRAVAQVPQLRGKNAT